MSLATATGVPNRELKNRAPAGSLQSPPPSADADTTLVHEDDSSDQDDSLQTPVDDADSPVLKASISSKSKLGSWATDLYTLESIFAPIIFTGLAFFTRLYQIGRSNIVTWDESHFGKFGSFYLKREFYFDLHPPLGKMLVGLSGYIAGYNGSFAFKNGNKFPEDMDYVTMRTFNAMFNVACIPAIYFTAKKMKLSLPAVWFVTLALLLDTSYIVLGKLILLDSMLVCFTFMSMLGLASFNSVRKQPFSASWFFWLFFTGISLGCVTSVKMVGLFMIGVVGVYTAVDLWIKFADTEMPIKSQFAHWFFRIVALIIVPFLIFALSFKIHFMILTNTGTGESNMSSLFQMNLNGTKIAPGPIDIAYGSEVTIKNQGRRGGLLHSHQSKYPKGSKQQQITGYSAKDNNNKWIVEYPRFEPIFSSTKPLRYLTDGDVIRLNHLNTKRNLHTHKVDSHVARNHFEVSAYGNLTFGDKKDNWVVEIVKNVGSDVNASRIHPLTTTFRLRNDVMNCYLTSGRNKYPKWGFTQGEVSCDKKANKNDRHVWWNIENHVNFRLPPGTNRTYPKTSFVDDFIQLYSVMMASNNGLIPDPDRYKAIESRAWEWPILHVGLRLCAWTKTRVRYFLMGHPTNTWLSTAGILVFGLLTFTYLVRWQRGFKDFTPEQLEKYAVAGVIPAIGWVFHYMPFVIMARVTYVHHYLPSFYFAILVLGFLFDHLTTRYSTNKYVNGFIYLVLYAETIGIFIYFWPIAFGMDGEPKNWNYLNWVSSWKIGQ